MKDLTYNFLIIPILYERKHIRIFSGTYFKFYLANSNVFFYIASR